MADYGLLFKPVLIRAFVSERKLMTRRIPLLPKGWGFHARDGVLIDPHGKILSPHSVVWPRAPKCGDMMYAKETHQLVQGKVRYYADLTALGIEQTAIRWRPSLFMKKEHARIWREISDIRYERLQDISEEDSIAEGVERDSDGWIDYLMPNSQRCVSAMDSFRSLWIAINGQSSWDENPIVRVISFKQNHENSTTLRSSS